MGMYDYLGGEQIKIFYVPIFSSTGVTTDEGAGTWHSGGSLRSFDENDELPLKTLYYQYPDNFLVYDFRFDDEVWVVRDGKFKKYVPYQELTEEDLLGPVYGYYGSEINIKTLEDFSIIKKDLEAAKAEDRKIELEVFPEGVINTIRNNMELFKAKEEYWKEVQYQGSNKFAKKWYPDDKFLQEKDFGEAIDVFCYIRERKDGEIIHKISNPKKDYEDCKSYIKALVQKNSNIIEKYKKWLNDENLLDEIGFEDLLQEALS